MTSLVENMKSIWKTLTKKVEPIPLDLSRVERPARVAQKLRERSVRSLRQTMGEVMDKVQKHA